MSEPIRDLETAVRELGSLPMPAGSEPQGSGPRSFALVGEVQAEDYDDAVYAAEQAYSGMRGQGYKGSISVDTGAGVSEAELDSAVQELSAFLRVRLALESARRGRRELRAELHTAQAHGRTLLEQRNAHAKELLKLRAERADREDEVSAAVGYTSGLEWSDLVGIVAANTTSLVQAERDVRALRTRVAELEAEREKLVRWHGEDSKTITTLVARVDRYRARATALQNDALSMRGSLAPADGSRKVPFELGETLAPAVDWLIARVAELERRIAAEECRCPEPAPLCEGCRCQCHTAAQPSAADPQALRKEDTADLVTLAPAHRAEADYDAAFQTISLELTATREQWSAWQKALKVDLARTTNRGSCTTSHATWRGIHVVIRYWPAEEDVTPQVQKLRTLLAGQREQAAADAPHEGPQHHTYRLGRDLPETGGAQ